MIPAADWPETPYPGARPEFSFLQVDEVVLPLGEASGRLLVDGSDLDDWLLARGEPPMADRTPVLSYGSNACPSKLVHMRHGQEARLRGAVVMTACTVEDHAAAWCTGRRRRDDAVPATLVRTPGVEHHFLWWVALEQQDALNECEGAPTTYELQPVAGTVRHTDGTVVPGVHAYVGVAESRLPRFGPDGRPLLVRDCNPNIAQLPGLA